MRSEILSLLEQKVKRYQKIEYYVVGPWDDRIDNETRAQNHRYLLGVVYGQGHPALSQPIEDLINSLKEGRMLTWLMYINNQPVGMANIEIFPEEGIAELCRTVRLPEGSILPDGSVLNGQVNNTVVMYQRLQDFLRSPLAEKIWCLQADLRLAAPIILPGGKILPGGAATQHINQTVGLNPWLLCVPRYQVHPKGGEPHQEVFFQSRLYLQDKGIDIKSPLYTPLKNSFGPISLLDIARATYHYAFGSEPIVDYSSIRNSRNSESYLEIYPTAGVHFSTIFARGAISLQALKKAVDQSLDQSRFVEIIISNDPQNIITQEVCYQANLIPLGVMPGGIFYINGSQKHIPTTFHFGAIRSEIRKQIVEIELARDYNNTPIEQITYNLHYLWKHGINRT